MDTTPNNFQIDTTLPMERRVILHHSEDGADGYIAAQVHPGHNLPVNQYRSIIDRILRELYADESGQDNTEVRQQLIDTVDLFTKQEQFQGTSDDFHNLAVSLARRDEYLLACDVLKCGLTQFRSCDLLADFLQYSISCSRGTEAREYFKILMDIPRRRYTWRAFSFAINFLQYLSEQPDGTQFLLQTAPELADLSTKGSQLPEERAMMSLVAEFKKYFPSSEEPYRVEAQVCNFMKDEKKELAVLRAALSKLKVCPKCALRLGDILFDRGDFKEAAEAIQRAITDSVRTQTAVNVGYLHYLMGLCKISDARKDGRALTSEDADGIYYNFNMAMSEFQSGRDSYREVIKRSVKQVYMETELDMDEKYSYLRDLGAY